MFVAYNLRMLIAVLDSIRVFDPGGQGNEMEKLNQNILDQSISKNAVACDRIIG
jgi:hypothetical protein